jgi:hypothetical protein
MLEIFDRAGGVPRYVLRQPARVIKKHQNTDDLEVWDTIVNKSMERIEKAADLSAQCWQFCQPQR